MIIYSSVMSPTFYGLTYGLMYGLTFLPQVNFTNTELFKSYLLATICLKNSHTMSSKTAYSKSKFSKTP